MTLEVLRREMVAAMKNKDKVRKTVISTIIDNVNKATILPESKNKDKKDIKEIKTERLPVTEELISKVIMKEKKAIQEMINTCPSDRVELLEECKIRMAIINEFVPQMMSEDEVRQTINHLIDGVEYGNKGSIMKVVSPVLKGKADMKMVNQIVTEICQKVK